METYRVEIGRLDEYERIKRLLNRGRHPTFIGRAMVARCTHNGGLLFFVAENGVDAAAALVNPARGVLLVLNVEPAMRGRGVGEFALNYIKPNFARVVESAVPWFEARGYTAIGTWKQGRSLRTRVMVRAALPALAGRLRARLGTQSVSAEAERPDSMPAPERVATLAESAEL